ISNTRNVESEIDDDYATMQLQQMYTEEKNGIENDYIIAMRLQEMYNKERTNINKEYETLTSRMNNISFENYGETPERIQNKSTDKKFGEREPYNKNFFQSNSNDFNNDDSPPPYHPSQKAARNDHGHPYIPSFNNNYFQEHPSVHQKYPQQFPQQHSQQFPHQFPPQQFSPYQQQTTPNYEEMFSQFMKFMDTSQNQNQKNNIPSDYDTNNNQNQKNSNQSDYDTYNTNFSQKPNRSKTNWFNRESGVFKILLLGGTGAGKSTIINTMTNYFLGGTLDKPKIVIPTKFYKVTENEYLNKHSESKVDDVTKSQTTKCHTYTFAHPDNPASKFILIDTPGLSDTSGVKQDDKNIQEIINTAISVGSLSAIVIIANGTEARITQSIKNTLILLSHNLPDELLGNLLLILTKCTKSSASFSVNDFSKEIARPKATFHMDNRFFCTDPEVWNDDNDERVDVEHNWKRSINSIDRLLVTITELSSTSTKAFENMKDYRNRIKSEIAKVTQDIANIQQVQDSLEAAQKALQKTGNQKNSYSNYTKTETVTLDKMVDAGYHSTICDNHYKNNIICHERCGLEMETRLGTNNLVHCSCMGSNDICTKCNCGPKSHYHTDKKMVKETKTLNKVLEDMKAQYDMASQQYQKYNTDANNYQSALLKLQAAANAKYELIHKLCKDLSKICSRFNFVDELHANIENMRQDARTIQNTNIRRNAEAEIKRLEKLATDLSSKR
ncbi:4190_t:CDS:2, partial [Dentiscutata erythropus]